jgi:hypothetical protein
MTPSAVVRERARRAANVAQVCEAALAAPLDVGRQDGLSYRASVALLDMWEGEDPAGSRQAANSRLADVLRARVPYSAVLPTWALDALETAFHCRPELIIYRGGICYFSRQAVDVLRSSIAMNLLGSNITDHPAGAELAVVDYRPVRPAEPVGFFALTYRVV